MLIIEDSSRLRRSLSNGLRHEGFATDATDDGREGLSYAEVYPYDAIILDIMLPSMDGLTVLKTLRAQGNDTHILILSAKDRLEDRLQGLDLGADDYLVKPFAFEELCSRLRALMRRRYQSKAPVVCLDGLVIDTVQRRASLGEDPLTLTRQEYALLEQLALCRGRVLSRDLLRDQLYTSEADVISNVIDVVVCTLRRKIKSAGGPAVIQTIRGQGYLIA